MLTLNDLRKVAFRSARDMGSVEIDVILTHLLPDLSEIAGLPLKRDIIRPLAVLKLWNSEGLGLDYGRFSERVKGGADYDVADLTNLCARTRSPTLT